jgi:hypothetical protein
MTAAGIMYFHTVFMFGISAINPPTLVENILEETQAVVLIGSAYHIGMPTFLTTLS